MTGADRNRKPNFLTASAAGFLVWVLKLSSWAEDAKGHEDEGHKGRGGLVLAGGDSAAAFELLKEVLHMMPLPVEFRVIDSRMVVAFARRRWRTLSFWRR